MFRVVKKYNVTCDSCRTSCFTAESDSESVALPNGWFLVEMHNCGLTGYDRVDLVCDKCHASRHADNVLSSRTYTVRENRW